MELKQYVVAGISSDIGRIIAQELSSDPLVQIVGTMRRAHSDDTDVFGNNVEIVDRCDLTTELGCSRLASLVDDRFDRPFGYIHSIGEFWEHVPFLSVSPQQARTMLESHVATLQSALYALIPLMRARGGASCIAFSCNSVRYNYPWMASFTTSKAAIESLIRSLANEFAGDGLRFNSLTLASVKTDKVHASKPHGDFEHYIEPKELVPIVRFLMSEEAHLINGNAISLFEHSPRYYREGYFERISK
ncbi:SDR family oxidoreductase [Rhodopseudomonas palustris]|uniref:SDR family oxidoreductase n=1 Tax=Rhodopseudomonas palustris TaxID=1076 RepID=UPI0021F2D9D9|nr:SDR family oxidoreductase [Rhodopseudomonas palustris]UYO42187.1 SDR family oxidoreductase [Rhodopseudomonas palustris]